jgi:DNA-binding XRE family transcriptional regulator
MVSVDRISKLENGSVVGPLDAYVRLAGSLRGHARRPPRRGETDPGRRRVRARRRLQGRVRARLTTEPASSWRRLTSGFLGQGAFAVPPDRSPRAGFLVAAQRPSCGRLGILNQCAPNQSALDRYAGKGHATWVTKPRIDQDPEGASAAFGERLRELRNRQGLSQDALAHATDIHSTAVGRMERGAREPRLTTILRLARGLGIPPGELLNDLGNTSQKQQVSS